jgi:hypothetical protein
MTTPDLERRIRTWFADEIGEPRLLRRRSMPSSMPSRSRVPQERGLFGRRAIVLLAAALLVGLVASAIAVGSGVIKLPSISPCHPQRSRPPSSQSQAAPPSPRPPSPLAWSPTR